jgi:Holliday junction resolvasome RuvABC DNA-binding subunit
MSESQAPAVTPTQAAANEIAPKLENNQQNEEKSLKGSLKEAVNSVNPLEASDDDYDDADDADDSEAETKAEKEARKWKLKVGGKEIEISDEQELIKRAQMGYSAEQKWKEASEVKKQMEGFIKTLQENPTYALQQMGFDVDEIAKAHLEARIQEMQKSPEQLEREKLQKELEEIRREREKEKEESRSREIQQLQEKYAVEVETQISDALDNMKSLPKSPYTVKRIADAMILAFQKGKYDVTANDVLPIVERQIKEELQDMFGVMPEELIEAVVGKENFNRVRKKRVGQAKKPQTKQSVQSTGQTEINKVNEAQSKPKEKISSKEFFKRLGSF